MDAVVVTEVRGADLLQGVDGGQIDGSIEVELLDASETRRAHLDQPFALLLGGRRGDLEATGLRYFATFPGVAPGSYRIRVTARNSTAQTQGTGEALLEVVPAPGAFLWPPLVAATSDRWLTYVQSVGAGAETPGSYPFVRDDGTQFVPRAAARLPEHGATSVEVFGFRLQDGDFELAADLEAAEKRLSVLPGGAVPARGGRVHLRASVTTEGASDDWLPLRVRVQSGDGAVSLEASAPVIVDASVAAAVADEDPLAAPEFTEVAEVEIDDNARGAARQLLGMMADHGLAEALALYLRMESGGSDGPATQEEITAVRKRSGALVALTRRIAKKSPRAVLPVLLLQQRLSQHYAEERNVWRGAFSVSTQFRMAGAYVERAPEGAVPSPAQVLAVLGDLYGALEHDPANELALLRLGMEAERHGNWTIAAQYFDNLRAVRPHDDEVLLRLALNWERLGLVAEARELLGGLLGRPRVESRVAVLAFQHLSRLDVQRGSTESAAGVLERGIQLFPESQRLRLSLGLLYEQLGRRRDAVRLLNRISAALPPAVETPRTWYTHVPEDEIHAAQSAFATAALDSLPALRDALATLR